LNGYLVLLMLVIVWTALLLAIRRFKPSKHVSLFGPAIMLRTERSRGFIERVGRASLWRRYGDFAVLAGVITMIVATAFLAWEATLVSLIPRGSGPSLQTLLALPGINPLIPLSYGLIAMIIGVVLHEFSHGIVAACQKLKINSVGVLLLIVPVGAFVELDEKELQGAERIKRVRVQAAGAITNLVIAGVMLLLFLSAFAGVAAVSPGVVITQAYPGVNQGLRAGMEIVSIAGAPVSLGLLNNMTVQPGVATEAVALYRGASEELSVYPGVVITGVINGTPASAAGLRPGDLITGINGITMYNEENLSSYLTASRAGQNITVFYLQPGPDGSAPPTERKATMTLMNKYSFYASYEPSANSPSFNGTGFMGVASAYMGIAGVDAATIPRIMSNPFGYSHGFVQGILTLIVLPFEGLAPLPYSVTQLYRTPLYPSLFWPLVNTAFWMFWINLLLGMTNLLPLIPFDGGYLFRDVSQAIAERLGIRRGAAVASAATAAASIIIVGLLLWQLIGPMVI